MAEKDPSIGRAGQLADKVILVVGGTTGIGASVARAMNAQGAMVTVTSHDSETVAALRDDSLAAIETMIADARDSGATNAVVAEIVARHGRLDGLCHVAGGSGRRFGDGPIDTVSDEGWRATMALNLESVFHSNRAAVQQFLRQDGGGAIVNFGSVLARSPAPRHFATHAYAAAKAGVEGLTRSVAAQYAGSGIRANVIVAGLTDTPMAARALGDPDIMRFVTSKQPLGGGRAGRPGDFDAAVVFMFSDGAAFVTGQTLAVDGGWSCTDGQYASDDKDAAVLRRTGEEKFP